MAEYPRILSIDEDRRGGPNGQEQLPLRLRVGFRRALGGDIEATPGFGVAPTALIEFSVWSSSVDRSQH